MGIPHYSNHPEGVAKVPCFNLDSIYRLDLAPTDNFTFSTIQIQGTRQTWFKKMVGYDINVHRGAKR